MFNSIICSLLVSYSSVMISPASSGYPYSSFLTFTGRECWAFVSAYGPGCERSEEERDEFWNELTRCVVGLSTGRLSLIRQLWDREGAGLSIFPDY